MRQAIADDDVNAFAEYLPEQLKDSARILLDKISPKKTESVSEMIFRMINETMDENTMAGGSVQVSAGGGSFGPPNTTDVWKTKEDDEDEEDNIDEDKVIDEVFKKLFSRSQNKGSKSNVH